MVVAKTTSSEFRVRLSKAEVVRAAVPAQQHWWVPQSNLDLLLPPLNFGVFFCYQNTPELEFSHICSVLKASLAEALVSYFALAGEVVQNPSGEPEVLCNNRGVDFVEAVADVELRDVNFYEADEAIDGKLVPRKKHGVLAVQVTKLKCGGVVVACTFDHRVADAYSANMFLVSWSETALSKPLSQLPCFRRSLLLPRRPGRYDPSVAAAYTLISALPPPPRVEPVQQTISRIYYIELHEINRIQSLANSREKKHHRITKIEAFSAFLWKTIAAAAAAGEIGQESLKGYFGNFKLGVIVDGRGRIDQESLKGYFGNCLSIPFGEKPVNDLRRKPLTWVANVVHEFLERALTKEHFLGLVDWVEAHRPEPAVARVYASGDEGPAVVVSSGRQFPMKKIDFGWDKPVFGSYHFPWGEQSGYVMPMPSPRGNGDWVVYMHLLKGHLDLIEALAPHVFKPLT